MLFAMSSLVFLFLSLLTVRRTSGVNCTIEDYNPCRCVLSGGYSGVVDFSPIFKDGPLYYHDLFTLEFNPCVTEKNKYAVTYRDDSQIFRYGSIGTEIRDLEFSEFLVNEDKFQFDLKYFSKSGHHDVLVTFMYQPAVDHKVDLLVLGPFYNIGPIARDGVKLKVVSKYVKPLIFSVVDTVESYSIEHDVCAGWHGERPLLDQVGMLGLAAPVVSLNTTYSMYPSEYYLGVCANPLKGSGTSEDCYAVRRAYNSFDYETQCIGRGIQAMFVNQRDQGWMLLRYPFSDYIDDCNGYTVTEILFTCDHRAQATSSPLYPENDFIYTAQCRYQFVWPTHLACPNLTSPSGGSPSSLNPSSILLGMSGSVLVLLLLVTVGVSVSTCYLCRRERTRRSVNLDQQQSDSVATEEPSLGEI